MHIREMCSGRSEPACLSADISRQADYGIVVSLAKTGTNLVANLLRRLGYRCVGQGLRETYPEIEKRVAALGRRIPNQNGGLWHPEELLQVLHEFPPRTCLFLHRLDIGPSLLSWCKTHQPPLFFNYRDPRDTLISLVNYLLARANDRYTELAWNFIHAQILATLPDTENQLTYAINQMDRHIVTFREHAWLLYHPRVCKLAYEKLVGPEGGGDRQSQERVIQDVLDHLNADGEPRSIADQVYDRSARTFHRGRAGAWLDVFGGSHVRAFEEKYGDILAVYGYASGGDAGRPAAEH